MKWSLIIPGVFSASYCLAVILFVRVDRKSHTGGFINLQGMLSFLALLPASLFFEKVDKFRFRSNLQAALCMLLNAGLIFGLVFLVLKAFQID